MVQSDASDRQALRQLPNAFVPAYLGPSGWTGLDLDENADWQEVHELLQESYMCTAPRRLADALLA